MAVFGCLVPCQCCGWAEELRCDAGEVGFDARSEESPEFVDDVRDSRIRLLLEVYV